MSDEPDEYAPTAFDPAHLCERIDARLRDVGMTRPELVKKAGLCAKTISRWKDGVTVPQVGSVRDVAAALGLTYEALTQGLRPPHAPAPASPPDPYDPRRAATNGLFVGRHATLKALAEALEQRRSTSVVGDRRIGKTSLLLTWAERARAGGAAVTLVSAEKTSGVTARALVLAITDAEAPDDPDGAADALAAWIAKRRDGRPPLILIDEFDELARRIDNRFFQRLRGMVGEGVVVLVLATCRYLSDLAPAGHTSPFDNLLAEEPLGLLEPAAADELIALRRDALGPEDQALIQRWAGRHPFYIKLLAHHLVRAADGGRTRERAIEAFRDEAGHQLHHLWSHHLRAGEQTALRIVLLPEDGASVGERAHAKALRSLQRRGLVTEQGAPFGEVLTRWIEELT